jgi:hypothetical protein
VEQKQSQRSFACTTKGIKILWGSYLPVSLWYVEMFTHYIRMFVSIGAKRTVAA